MDSTGPTPGSVKSADRVLTLFELLGTWARGMSHSEIAQAMGIPKSSLTQLLKNLVGRDWLTYSAAGKVYAIGPAFARIARQAEQSPDLIAIASPALTTLTARTSESSALNVLKGDLAEVVATVMGPQRLVSHMRLGDVAPLYATSGGKILLAFMPAEQQAAYLRRIVPEARTQATIQSVPELRRQLREIQTSDLAFSYNEWTPGITGMARPVRSAGDEVVGSVNVAVPSIRFTETVREQIDAALCEAVQAMERQLRRS